MTEQEIMFKLSTIKLDNENLDYMKMIGEISGKLREDLISLFSDENQYYYIAKKDTWFKEGTKCVLLEDYGKCGLYNGIYVIGNDPYDTFWLNKGFKEGNEVNMNEVCEHAEFDIYTFEEYNKINKTK